MTEEIMALREMIEKSSDADIVREMIGFAAERLDGAGGGRAERGRAWLEEP